MSIEITGGSWKEKFDKLQEAYEELEAERDWLEKRLDKISRFASAGPEDPPDTDEVLEGVMARFDALEALVKQATAGLGPILRLPTGTD